jgi:hypothetical protein
MVAGGMGVDRADRDIAGADIDLDRAADIGEGMVVEDEVGLVAVRIVVR